MRFFSVLRLPLLLAAACGTSPPTSAADAATQLPPIVHTVTASAQGILVNGYLVESAHGVVCVDSALTVSDARALRARLDALAKPLLAVVLTHGHPDHYNGVATLTAGLGDVPVYATAGVSAVIRDSDAAKEAQWKPSFGAEWPDERVFPDHVVENAQVLSIDGLTWQVTDLGAGESHADSIWTVAAEQPLLFLGDSVLYRVHAYTADGHTAAWLENLEQLERDVPAGARLFPGHGQAGGPELLRWQVEYLGHYRREVDTLRAGKDHLNDAEERELEARMVARYPEQGLVFLIALGADAVARELAARDMNAAHAQEQP